MSDIVDRSRKIMAADSPAVSSTLCVVHYVADVIQYNIDKIKYSLCRIHARAPARSLRRISHHSMHRKLCPVWYTARAMYVICIGFYCCWLFYLLVCAPSFLLPFIALFLTADVERVCRVCRVLCQQTRLHAPCIKK